MLQKTIRLLRILSQKRSRKLFFSLQSKNDLKLSMTNAMLMRNTIMEEIKFQTNLLLHLNIPEKPTKESIALFQAHQENIDLMAKDLLNLKLQLLQANYRVQNNNRILKLEFYVKKLENLEKLIKLKKKVHKEFFSSLKINAELLHLKQAIARIEKKLDSVNTSTFIKLKLNYKHYKKQAEITKTIVKQ